MSGTSFSEDCYKCGGKDTILASSDYKPHNTCFGECIQCGYTYWTVSGQMSLDELNEIRCDNELEELKELPEIDLNYYEKQVMEKFLS